MSYSYSIEGNGNLLYKCSKSWFPLEDAMEDFLKKINRESAQKKLQEKKEDIEIVVKFTENETVVRYYNGLFKKDTGFEKIVTTDDIKQFEKKVESTIPRRAEDEPVHNDDDYYSEEIVEKIIKEVEHKEKSNKRKHSSDECVEILPSKKSKKKTYSNDILENEKLLINEIKKSAGISEDYTHVIHKYESFYHGLYFKSIEGFYDKGNKAIFTFNFKNGKVTRKIDGLLRPDRVLLNALKKKYGY